MIYEFQCIICDKHFDIVQRMNEEHKAFHCGIEALRVWTVPRTDKDLAYNFVTESFGKPIQINSKSKYKNLIKRNGFMDASPKEVRQEAEFRKRINQEDYSRDRKKLAEKIFVKNKEKIRNGYARK